MGGKTENGKRKTKNYPVGVLTREVALKGQPNLAQGNALGNRRMPIIMKRTKPFINN